MRIVLDMDNTLTDDNGRILRPGIVELLSKLKLEGHTLILWTSSPGYRAEMILKDVGLWDTFSELYYKEAFREYGVKDIKLIQGDIIIDDDPEVVKFNISQGNGAFLVKSFRNIETILDDKEIISMYNYIRQRDRNIKNTLFKWFTHS